MIKEAKNKAMMPAATKRNKELFFYPDRQVSVIAESKKEADEKLAETEEKE